MNRREFSKNSVMLGVGALAGFPSTNKGYATRQSEDYYEEPSKKLPIRKFDVVVVGGGTGAS